MSKLPGESTSSLIISLIVLLILCPSGLLFAQSKTDKISSLMDSYCKYRRFNGAILIAENGDILFQKGYGFANFEAQVPNSADTKFRIASITKSFTAIMVMQLVEEGRLSLDGKINDYLPEYPAVTGNRISIHHLLSHTSGIIDYPDVPENFDIRERIYHTTDELLDYFADKDLKFEPGSSYAYSNFGYVLLAVMMEKVSGLSYEQLLKNRILIPAGMTSSGVDDNHTVLAGRAQGYHHRFESDEPVNAPFIDMSVVIGSGCIYSTAEDIFRFDCALYDETLISAESLQKILTPVVTQRMQYYGYGWDIRQQPWGTGGEEVSVVGCSGSINGFRSNYRRIAADSLCIVVFCNYKDVSGLNVDISPTNDIVEDIAAILYDRKSAPPLRSAAAICGRALVNGNRKDAEDRIRQIENNQSELIIFDEDEFYEVTKWFLRRNMDDLGLITMQVCERNTAVSPLHHARISGLYHIAGQSDLADNSLRRALDKNQWQDALLNMIGYEFINLQRMDAAVMIFKRNVDAFPESANAYDSMGEAYMISGKNDLAIESYKKSLMLNPDNYNASQMIDHLTKTNGNLCDPGNH